MKNATIVVRMVIKLMKERRYQNLKENVTNARSKVTRHLSVDPNHSI